jgi:type II secretory pathway component PulK
MRDRSATILVVVLVVIAVLSLSAYTFSEMMRTEYRAAKLYGRQVQCRALADSGLEMVQAYLALDAVQQEEMGWHFDNPQLFQGLLVTPLMGEEDDSTESERGRFTILATQMSDDGTLGGVRYGLEDESARVNLNAIVAMEEQLEGSGLDLLMALPGMTEEIADAILDWLDEDDESREFGAEIDHYSGMVPPYAPKNGPLESIEELLLVRGVTPELLFGFDTNRNGTIDANEAAGNSVGDFDNSDGSLDLGWANYLTLFSLEKNMTPEGGAKIDLNNSDAEALYDQLVEVFDEEWATFIVAYKQNGPTRGGGDAGAASSGGGGGELDLTKEASVPLQTVLDLIGAQVTVRFRGDERDTVLNSPFPEGPIAMALYLPKLLDNVSVNPAPIIPGRININQAPRAILLGIPGLDSEQVDQIISLRDVVVTDERPDRRFETWLMSEGIVTLSEMKQLMPFVCAGGAVYRAQIVGYFDDGGPGVRFEAVIDATTGDPRVVFWRDLSHLGRGYDLGTLGVMVDEEQDVTTTQ